MAKNKISLSFSKKYLDLYTVLKSKENSSEYICNLIRADLETSDGAFEFRVEQILEKILDDKKLIYNSSDKPSENTGNKATDEDIDLILNIF